MGDDLLPRLQSLKDADIATHVFACLYRLHFEPIRRQAYKDNILTVDLLNRLLRYKDRGDARSRCELRARQHFGTKAIVWIPDLNAYLY